MLRPVALVRVRCRRSPCWPGPRSSASVCGYRVFGEQPVAVHGVEVELGRVNDEVVIEVLRVRQAVQEPAAPVESDFGLAPVADPRPGLGFLRGELHGDAVMRSALRGRPGPPR